MFLNLSSFLLFWLLIQFTKIKKINKTKLKTYVDDTIVKILDYQIKKNLNFK